MVSININTPHSALTQSTGTGNRHPAGHMEQVLLIHMSVRVFCLCFHCPSTISSSLCVRNNWETPPQPVSMCTPSPSAIFSSLTGRSECACRAWRSMSLCYTWKLFPANGTDLLLPPNLTSGNHFVSPCIGFLVFKSRDSTTAQASVRAASERLVL